MAGKGDKRRPTPVSQKQMQLNWRIAFEPEKVQAEVECQLSGHDLERRWETVEYTRGRIQRLYCKRCGARIRDEVIEIAAPHAGEVIVIGEYY